MEKKYILIIIIIIVLIAIPLAVIYTDSSNQVQIGSNTFKLPQGFKVVDSSKSDVVNITNGYDTIYLKECGDNDITKYVNKYVKDIKDNNKTAKTKNFTVDNVIVYKSTVVNNTHTIHYWFEHNGKVYTCYTYDANKNTEDIVTDLIKNSK